MPPISAHIFTCNYLLCQYIQLPSHYRYPQLQVIPIPRLSPLSSPVISPCGSVGASQLSLTASEVPSTGRIVRRRGAELGGACCISAIAADISCSDSSSGRNHGNVNERILAVVEREKKKTKEPTKKMSRKRAQWEKSQTGHAQIRRVTQFGAHGRCSDLIVFIFQAGFSVQVHLWVSHFRRGRICLVFHGRLDWMEM